MKLDVSEFEGRREIKHRYTDFDLEDPDLTLREQPTLQLALQRHSDGIHTTGTVTATVEALCDRCLTALPIALKEEIDLLYLPLAAAPTEKGEHELVEEQDFILAYYEDETIDLDALVREQIQLALPVRQLCAEACKGLCPTCGADLNKADCGCAKEVLDPRWEALAEWRQKHES